MNAKTLRFVFLSVLTLFWALFWTVSVQAVAYKNPAHEYKQGDVHVGIAISNFSRALTSEGLGDDTYDVERTNLEMGMGVGTSGLLALHLGSVGVEGEDGAEYGLSYRHRLEGMGRGGMRLGFLASYRYGYIVLANDDEMDFEQTDLGFGGSVSLQDNLNLYFGGVLSFVAANYYAYYDYYLEAQNVLGGFGGVEYVLDDSGLVGFEVHLLHETGFSAYLEWRL